MTICNYRAKSNNVPMTVATAMLAALPSPAAPACPALPLYEDADIDWQWLWWHDEGMLDPSGYDMPSGIV